MTGHSDDAGRDDLVELGRVERTFCGRFVQWQIKVHGRTTNEGPGYGQQGSMALYRARAHGMWVIAVGLIASILGAVHLGWVAAALFGFAVFLTARSIGFAHSAYRIAVGKKNSGEN